MEPERAARLPFRKVAFVMHSGWTFLFQRAHHFAARFRAAGAEVSVFEVSGLRSRAENLLLRRSSKEQRDTTDHLWTALYPYRIAQRLPALEAALQPAVEASFRRFVARHVSGDTLLWLHGVNMILPPEVLLAPSRHASLVDVCDDFAAFFPDDARMQRKLEGFEDGTARGVDLVVASAARLAGRLQEKNARTALVRNAVSQAFLDAGARAARHRRPGAGRKLVVGYQGAFASWLDFELVGALADRLPHAELRLMGRVYADVRGDMERLCARPNVRHVGLVPHDELPAALAELDVGLVPFRINELTLATDPIKLYEYLACGVPVVATPMPEVELRKEDGVVAVAADAAGTARAVEALGAVRREPGALGRRMALARANTWDARFAQVLEALPR